MNSWKIYALALVIASTAGFAYVHKGPRHMQPDFRDAVADNAGAQDFNSETVNVGVSGADVSVPPAAAPEADIDGLSADLLSNAIAVAGGLEMLNKYDNLYLKEKASMSKSVRRVYEDISELDKTAGRMLGLREQLAVSADAHKRIVKAYGLIEKMTAVKIVSAEPGDMYLVQGIEGRLTALKVNLQILAGEFKK